MMLLLLQVEKVDLLLKPRNGNIKILKHLNMNKKKLI